MADPEARSGAQADNNNVDPVKATGTGKPMRSSMSMHDGVEVWCDCCSCEAEPYWIEAMRDYDLNH